MMRCLVAAVMELKRLTVGQTGQAGSPALDVEEQGSEEQHEDGDEFECEHVAFRGKWL